MTKKEMFDILDKAYGSEDTLYDDEQENEMEDQTEKPIATLTIDSCFMDFSKPDLSFNRTEYFSLAPGIYELFTGPQHFIKNKSWDCDLVTIDFEKNEAVIKVPDDFIAYAGKYKIVKVE